MSSEKVDVVIIGSGVAGMTAGAMLARNCGKQVVVFERSPFLGGRCLSYVGRANKVVADGIELDARAFRKSLPLAHCSLGKCTPELETIFSEGLLDGRTFEAGGHGLFWGNRGRIDRVLDHFGKRVEQPLNRGLGFVEWQGLREDGTVRTTTAHQVRKGKPYPWMSAEGFSKTIDLLGDMARLTPEDLGKLSRKPLQDWLAERNLHPEAYAYVKVLAAAQTGRAEPRMTAAEDFLGYMATAQRIGMNLTTGSVASADEPGTIAIPLALEDPIAENGGSVRRNTPVTRVLIEHGRITGVEYREESERRVLHADQVICTLPPKYAFQVLPSEHFPADWVRFVRDEHRGIGLLTGWAGTKRSLLGDLGLEESSFVFMPGITDEDEGFIGVVDMIMCDFTAWADGKAKRAPEGKSDFYFSTALTDAEMRNPERVNLVIERCEAWARANFPTWEEDVEFILWTPSPEALGTARPVGKDRIAHRSVHVEGLWFAGDQYGEKNWGCGIDSAALSGVVCVDQMMGTVFETTLFPSYHQGIPVDSDPT
jgi:monoamine oxidase